MTDSSLHDFAPGTHVLLDAYGARHLDDAPRLRDILRRAATACGATVLSDTFHRFDGRGGVTGVVALQESHISIHTWPETGFAAIDIFLCGTLSSNPAIDALIHDLAPKSHLIKRIPRGVPDPQDL